jgi:hypothetical protein
MEEQEKQWRKTMKALDERYKKETARWSTVRRKNVGRRLNGLFSVIRLYVS